MKRKRIFLIDEIIDSCRLMPSWVQTILFLIPTFFIPSFLIPIISDFLLNTIIILQLIFIILLIKKNIVYRRISKMEVAVRKMVIWIYSKKDESEKQKKKLINLGLIVLTLLLFYELHSFKLLLVNGIFCFLFFLKIIFYVPLISIRIIEDEHTFYVIDKGLKVTTEIPIYKIKEIEVKSNKIEVETTEDKIEIPMDFNSGREVGKLKVFLKKINQFEVK